jgi:acetoacetyl-CoA synthetase
MPAPLWSPTPAQVEAANLTRFTRFGRDNYAPRVGDDYPALHRWSVEHRGDFWAAVWRFCGVIGDPGGTTFVPGPHMTEATWFPDARLNFAENLLRPAECDDRPALIARTELGDEQVISRKQLLDRATAFAAFLRGRGVTAGDRVAAVVPNTPEAVIAMLGATAVGAVWSSCSPDFGADAICDRFGQIAPKVLVTTAYSSYNGKPVRPAEKVRSLLPRLPGVETVIVAGGGEFGVPFEEAVSSPKLDFVFERFPFDHPVYILYSSGTTGAPKCIVHGAGGTLLQHLKEHQLHTDVRPGDRLFFYTTTGWMMWNWLVSGLASGAAAVLYDGSPFHPDHDTLFRLATDHGVTQFGAGAKFYAAVEKAGANPRERFDLRHLRCVLSTGSPLLPESFDFIHSHIKPDVCLASISGGTDIVSCFVLGCPTRPVHRGEIQCKGLGMDVHVYDADGRPVVGEPGELVCASPFPSMPVGFWNDPDKVKYLGSYFGVYGNVWCHGDWAEETPVGGFVIYGRSDATLNPGGVRIGTAEIYQQVEAFPEVAESLATALRRGGDEQIVLFVRMQPGRTLNPELIDALKRRLREQCSPRHVPAHVIQAPDFPRTISGKLSELAVRNALHGLPVKNEAALANPEALAFFRTVPESRSGPPDAVRGV